MGFKEGDRVRFKSDPEGHVYRVFLVNLDDTLDLRDDTGTRNLIEFSVSSFQNRGSYYTLVRSGKDLIDG